MARATLPTLAGWIGDQGIEIPCAVRLGGLVGWILGTIHARIWTKAVMDWSRRGPLQVF